MNSVNEGEVIIQFDIYIITLDILKHVYTTTRTKVNSLRRERDLWSITLAIQFLPNTSVMYSTFWWCVQSDCASGISNNPPHLLVKECCVMWNKWQFLKTTEPYELSSGASTNGVCGELCNAKQKRTWGNRTYPKGQLIACFWSVCRLLWVSTLDTVIVVWRVTMLCLHILHWHFLYTRVP